jgi:hypothetical protein
MIKLSFSTDFVDVPFFYTLLSMIILKWIGYDNRVVNYPKIHEGFTEIRLKEEEAFRQV